MEEQKNGQESGKQGQKPHKRRKRYSGTHPKKYEEKYKELNPEKYGDTIEKVIGKGSTPAGMHISICVQELSLIHIFYNPIRHHNHTMI